MHSTQKLEVRKNKLRQFGDLRIGDLLTIFLRFAELQLADTIIFADWKLPKIRKYLTFLLTFLVFGNHSNQLPRLIE